MGFAYQDAIVLTSFNSSVAAIQAPPTGQAFINGQHAVSTNLKETLRTAWTGVELLLRKAERSLGGTPFQGPVALVNGLIELISAVSDNKDELHVLMTRTMERLLAVNESLAKNDETDSGDMMKVFAGKLINNINELDKMAKMAGWKQILESEKDKLNIARIFKDINEQTKDFQMRLALKIDRNTHHLRKSLDVLQLNSWPRSDRALYDTNLEDAPTLSRCPCTPGTRASILKRIHEWAQDPSPESPCVFWLTGQAGSGKSTIAYTIAHDLDKDNEMLNCLQATFFCSRQFEDMRRQKNIVPTLVYQLARHSQLYAKSLLAADKLDSVNKQLAKQMQDLLVGPWEKCNSDRSIDLPPYLVIIDALDEIDGKGG
ncbi:hypothetical protein C0991_006921, partial [Blastosporella zonata]